MSSATVAAASAAAQQQLLLQHKEEEELTKYSDAELQGDWEFKILRSPLTSFKDPETFRQVCDEEGRAGWILLEKFDDSRLRFKRPISARARDAGVDFDPYRTQYKTGAGKVAAIIAASILLAIALAVTVVLVAKK
jgi:SH3-like domain-containing protein